MFQIKLLPPTELGPEGQRLGEIAIGEFVEQFHCSPITADGASLEATWRKELSKLLEGELAVALPFDPRFAWVVYREGGNCYVQQSYLAMETSVMFHIEP